MDVGRICTKEVIAVEPGDTIARVTQLLRENHVGCVVVHEGGRPVGIVTDRDVAVRCGARREPIADIKVSEVMTKSPHTALMDEDVLDVLERMRQAGVRRIPVLNEAGLLAGILTLDDILLHVARSMKHVAEVVLTEISHEG